MIQGQVTVRVVDASREDDSLSIEESLKSLPTLRETVMWRGDLLDGNGIVVRRLPKVKGYRLQWFHTDRGQPEVVTVGYVRKEEGG